MISKELNFSEKQNELLQGIEKCNMDFENPLDCKMAMIQALRVSYEETERDLIEAVHQAIRASEMKAFKLVRHIFETHGVTLD